MASELITAKTKHDTRYENLESGTINLIQKMADSSEEVAVGQMNRQLKRTMTKGTGALIKWLPWLIAI